MIPGTYKENSGLIIKAGPGRVVVAYNVNCKNEPGCHGCNLCAQKAPAIKLGIKVRDNIVFQAGMPVIVRRFVINDGLSAAVLFGFPILFSFAALFVSWKYFGQSFESGVSVLFSFAACAAGFASAIGFDRLVRRLYPASIVPVKQDSNGNSNG
jgi:hypothetical protein